MKKLLVFAAIAMVAGSVMAQALSWIGDSGIYCVEGATWYNTSGNWAGRDFQHTDFGLVTSLTLGGLVSTLWDDGATHPTTIVQMGYRVDSSGNNFVTLPWRDFNVTPNEDRWENMMGVDVVAATGVGPGSHTLSVWFQANDGVNTVYDSNGGSAWLADFQTPVPEPATMSLLGLGALALGLRRKMRK